MKKSQDMEVSLNYCSQNGGDVYRAPYYNRNPNIGPRIFRNLDQYPYVINWTPKAMAHLMLARSPLFKTLVGISSV